MLPIFLNGKENIQLAREKNIFIKVINIYFFILNKLIILYIIGPYNINIYIIHL